MPSVCVTVLSSILSIVHGSNVTGDIPETQKSFITFPTSCSWWTKFEFKIIAV